MLTSHHWPNGALLLTALRDTFLTLYEVSSTTQAPPRRILARTKLHHTFAPTDISPHISADVPFRSALSNHAQLSVATHLHHLAQILHTLSQEAFTLPGLRAHRLLPYLSASLLQGDLRTQPSMSGTLLLQRQTLTLDDQEVHQGDVTFLGFARFERRAQAWLDSIDTLCRYAPNPDDPAWCAFIPAGPRRERADPIGLPFLAPSEKAAQAVLPILMGPTRVNLREAVLFRSPNRPNLPFLHQALPDLQDPTP